MGEDSCFLPQGPQGHVIPVENEDVHTEQEDPKPPSADTAVRSPTLAFALGGVDTVISPQGLRSPRGAKGPQQVWAAGGSSSLG